MFCCKKRKARKAAKAQAVVSSLAAVESALEGKTAEMFAEKLTGNKKALKKARKATAKTVRAAEKELARIERCLLYTSPSPRDRQKSRMPSSA